MLQRDVFIEEVTKRLEKDKSIYFLSADFGAAALDSLRERFPKNFLHCGISEQAMLDIASGLALEGNKVFVYAMAPFISLRSIEQAKCGAGLMNLPICVISVGIGLGYADAGPTHYSTEDYACFRSIVGSSIYTPSDINTTKLIAIIAFPFGAIPQSFKQSEAEWAIANGAEELDIVLPSSFLTFQLFLTKGSGLNL